MRSHGSTRLSEHVVFDGNEGVVIDGSTYRLACGAIVAETATGRLLVVWLSGSAGEPAEDNCVLIAHSDDAGKCWSHPRMLVPAGPMASAMTVLGPQADGTIVALGAFWPARERYTVWEWFTTVSRDDGITWSDRSPVRLRNANNIAVCSGFCEPDGTHYLPAQFFERRVTALVAPVELLAHAPDEKAAQALRPAGKDEQTGGKFATHLHGCSVCVSRDPSLHWFEERGRITNRPLGLLEPAIVRFRDGTLVMLMRAEWGGYLWRAESSDDGYNWTSAWQTDIRNPTSLIQLVRLSDGRIALLHNDSGGEVGRKSKRDPLSVWISDDEMKSWKVRLDVAAGGQLAYPNGIVTRDGSMVLVYDRNRREVRLIRLEFGQ